MNAEFKRIEKALKYELSLIKDDSVQANVDVIVHNHWGYQFIGYGIKNLNDNSDELRRVHNILHNIHLNKLIAVLRLKVHSFDLEDFYYMSLYEARNRAATKKYMEQNKQALAAFHRPDKISCILED